MKRNTWSDTLKRLVSELKNKYVHLFEQSAGFRSSKLVLIGIRVVRRSDAVRTRAAKELSKFVSAMEREQKAEVFSTFMADLNRNIFEMINGNTPQENLGAVIAICTFRFY